MFAQGGETLVLAADCPMAELPLHAGARGECRLGHVQGSSDLGGQATAFLRCTRVDKTASRAARAWQYREQLRDILSRKQPRVVLRLLTQ